MRDKIAKDLAENIEKDFNRISEEFDQTRKNNWEEFFNYLPYIKNGDQLLDLGCGNSRFLKFLIENGKKVKYFGLDKSGELLKKAKQNQKDDNQAVFIKGDMSNLPFGPDQFDAVCVIASFHHLPSLKLRGKTLKEIHRVLKTNGIFIISVWNLFQPKYKKYLKKAFFRWLTSLGKYDKRDTFIPWSASGINRYYYAFKRAELKNLIVNFGFKIIKEHIGRNLIFICQK